MRTVKRLKVGVAIAATLLSYSSVFSAITFEFPGDYTIPDEGKGLNGPVASPVNTTDLKWEVYGWRFYSDLAWTKLTGDDGGSFSTTETPDGYLHEATFSRPDLYLLPPRGNDNMGMSYNWEQFNAGGDANPHDVSVFLKFYDKGIMPLPIDSMEAIEPEAVTDYVSSFPEYYNTDYRYLDTLGSRGGEFSGGFYDTWNGETQVQIALPKDTFELSKTQLWIAPETAGGPNYWMALAMLQEYFNGDMQFQMTIGFKETMAGLAAVTPANPYLDGNKKNNNDGAFGPFEVESFTYTTGCQYYPQFFPKYTKDLSNAASEFNFGVDTKEVRAFTSEYCGAMEGTYLHEPYIIGCMLGSHHTFRRIYDLLSNARMTCFKEFLVDGADRNFIRATLGVLYNRGITAPGNNTFGDTTVIEDIIGVDTYKNYINDPEANEYIAMGNSEYRHHLLENFDRLEEYNILMNNDLTVPIYDEWITIEDVKNFFFGAGGSAASQGDGGLGAHFVIEDRAKLWADLQSGFATLAEHWEESPNVISYRYDWLTLLRVAKNHFPVVYKPRPSFGEAANWMDKRDVAEGELGCDGTPVDKTFPHVTLMGTEFNGSKFVAQFAITDNQGVNELRYTTDTKWNSWENGFKAGGDDKNGIWKLEIDAADISEGDTVWVGGVDSSGNAEVKPIIATTMGSVGNSVVTKSPNIGMKITLAQNKIALSGITDGNVSINFYTLSGRLVSQLSGVSNFGVANFEIPQMARGAYLMKIESKDQARSLKIMK